MTDDTLRSVRIERTGTRRYIASNRRGATIAIGPGENAFTPVELLLAAIGSCTAADVDVATSRHAEPAEFSVTVSGDVVHDQGGNRMSNLAVSFSVTFPSGKDGDAARAIVPRAVRLSHDQLCTVSRTVELGTPVAVDVENA